MSSHLQHTKQPSSLAGQIQQAAGVALNHCYQCGKCAAGCPVADTMDLALCRTLRLLQYESPDFDRQHAAWRRQKSLCRHQSDRSHDYVQLTGSGRYGRGDEQRYILSTLENRHGESTPYV